MNDAASSVRGDEPSGGRVFFSSLRRSLEFEDQIRLVSVGVDIGSSTSHLAFSRLLLERTDSRYIVVERTVFHESEVLLTPYSADQTIDAQRLGAFVERQYALAGIAPAQIDTGALILTGTAVRRRNARAIGELFAAQAGKLVAVSAGDALETTLAAYGSGAVARSARDRLRVMNIDIGGGTCKIAVCEGGAVVDQTAIDVGARLVSFDAQGRVQRLEESGARLSAEVGLPIALGAVPDADGLQRLVEHMADCLFDALRGPDTKAGTAALLRLSPLRSAVSADVVTFSGGVSEYVYGRDSRAYGDLGPALASAIRRRAQSRQMRIESPDQGIRATVVGASQYTVQVSGGTIYVEPQATLPLRNVPVIAPALPLRDTELDSAEIAAAIEHALGRLGLAAGEQPIALCYRWQGSATFARLDRFCRAVAASLALPTRSVPLVLVGEGDVGGLVGLHLHSELKLDCPVVSIDGIELQEFDFIDIGALLDTSGAVPVVIKSLVFPGCAAPGRNGSSTQAASI